MDESDRKTLPAFGELAVRYVEFNRANKQYHIVEGCPLTAPLSFFQAVSPLRGHAAGATPVAGTAAGSYFRRRFERCAR